MMISHAALCSGYLLMTLLMEQLAQVVQTAGDGALVGVRVLQVLIRDISAGEEGALGLIVATLIHQDDARVQVGRWGKTPQEAQKTVLVQGRQLLALAD